MRARSLRPLSRTLLASISLAGLLLACGPDYPVPPCPTCGLTESRPDPDTLTYSYKLDGAVHDPWPYPCLKSYSVSVPKTGGGVYSESGALSSCLTEGKPVPPIFLNNGGVQLDYQDPAAQITFSDGTASYISDLDPKTKDK